MFQKRSCICVATIFAVGMGAAASADVAPYVTMDWFASSDNSGPVTFLMDQQSDFMTHAGPGAWTYSGAQSGVNGTWDLQWNITAGNNSSGMALAGPDSAFVTADLAVTNTSDTVQTFWALVTLALDNPIVGGTFMNGQASAAVTDFLGNGATLGTISSGQYAGDPIYTGLIDGGAQQFLMDSPFTLNAAPWSSTSISETFGQPVPVFGPDAQSSISVFLKFELTPGDTANVVGMFEIASAVPGPAGLPVLAGLGLFAGARRRRRA